MLSILLAFHVLPLDLVSRPEPADSLRVPVLVYHNIQPAGTSNAIRSAELTMRPEVFAAQMQYLKVNGFHVVSLAALTDAIEGKRTLPRPAVVITFDDGRVNQYAYAFPILKKLGFTATFFPFTHAIGRNSRYFTWKHLEEMQAAGMTIGSHTSLHVKVTQIRQPKQWREEIEGSREVLRKRLGSAGEFFAYPWGAMSAAGDSAVRAAGYRSARSFSGGAWNGATDRFRLHAIPISDDMAAFRRAVGYPPAMAPTTRKASVPRATASGRAAAESSRETSSPQAKNLMNGRRRKVP